VLNPFAWSEDRPALWRSERGFLQRVMSNDGLTTRGLHVALVVVGQQHRCRRPWSSVVAVHLAIALSGHVHARIHSQVVRMVRFLCCFSTANSSVGILFSRFELDAALWSLCCFSPAHMLNLLRVGGHGRIWPSSRHQPSIRFLCFDIAENLLAFSDTLISPRS